MTYSKEALTLYLLTCLDMVVSRVHKECPMYIAECAASGSSCRKEMIGYATFSQREVRLPCLDTELCGLGSTVAELRQQLLLVILRFVLEVLHSNGLLLLL